MFCLIHSPDTELYLYGEKELSPKFPLCRTNEGLSYLILQKLPRIYRKLTGEYAKEPRPLINVLYVLQTGG